MCVCVCVCVCVLGSKPRALGMLNIHSNTELFPLTYIVISNEPEKDWVEGI
jgi:hypothetical protein